MRLMELLHVETSAPMSSLERIIATAPRRYKVYTIPKRNGRGSRTIAHPAVELKFLQRVVLRNILDALPVSDIAMAYISERGILRNAQAHVGERWLLKLDFSNFFHSIEPRDWDRAVRRTEALGHWKADRQIFHKLLFWGAGGPAPRMLSIGAPTSPSISNLVCLRLDQWLSEQANERGLTVTRYADDIAVSGPNLPILRKFERDFEALLKRNRGLNLELNNKKRGIYGPGERKMVTGLILTPEGQVSIGRERKREIHALVHQCRVGNASPDVIMKTKGMLAFTKMAEIEFFERVREKYGNHVIHDIMRYEIEETALIDFDL